MATSEHNACPSCGANRWKQSVKRLVFTCRNCGHHRGPDGEKLDDRMVGTYRKAVDIYATTERRGEARS